MSTSRKQPEPVPDWKRRGWKSEAEWLEAQKRATDRHQRAAAALGIPWRAK